MSETYSPLQSLELASELAELCRAHGMGQGWIESSPSLEVLLGRVLEDCEDRLRGADLAPGGAGLVEVQHLMAFARRACGLLERGSPGPSLVSGVEDLERLRNAGRGPADDARTERTTELLSTLSTLCHKINNPLTSLMGRAQILQMKSNADRQDVLKTVGVIDEASRRVAALVQELAHVVGHAKEDLLSGR